MHRGRCLKIRNIFSYLTIRANGKLQPRHCIYIPTTCDTWSEFWVTPMQRASPNIAHTKGASLPTSEALSFGKLLLAFRKVVLAPSSGSSIPMNTHVFWDVMLFIAWAILDVSKRRNVFTSRFKRSNENSTLPRCFSYEQFPTLQDVIISSTSGSNIATPLSDPSHIEADITSRIISILPPPGKPECTT